MRCEEENTCGTPVLSGKMGTLNKVETIGKGIDYLTVIKHEVYYLGYCTASVSLFGDKTMQTWLKLSIRM